MCDECENSTQSASLVFKLHSLFPLHSTVTAGDATVCHGERPRRHPDPGRADIHQELAHGPRAPGRALHQVSGGGEVLQGVRDYLCGVVKMFVC